MSDLTISVRGTSESPARTRVQARDFELVVDEPPDLGGHDHGANPVEYILTGLAGCLNVVGHLVASEMGIELRSLEIRASGPLNPARLFGEPTDDRAGFKAIDIELLVDADADADMLERWRSTVESRCPVGDNLTSATPLGLAVRAANAAVA